MGVPDSFLLTERVAIITGAGKGIGAATAMAFAEAGADVVLAARTLADLDGVAARVRALGRQAVVVQTDVNDFAALATLVDTTIARLGRIDIVVNNAGGSAPKPLLETTADDMLAYFRFNVVTAFELSRLAVPHLLAHGGGAILHVSSMAGTKVNRGTIGYGTAKAALSHMTKLMATDLAPRIRVNAVLPGAIETPALAAFLDSKGAGIREHMSSRTFMRRNGAVDDIAAAALYLCSPASAWVTGKLLEVDGLQQDDIVPKNIPDL